MLRSLTFASLRVILLPCELGPFPLFEDIFDKISSERGIEILRALLMWTLGLGKILRDETTPLAQRQPFLNEELIQRAEATYEKGFDGQVVHVDPDRTSPVVFSGMVVRIVLAQASYSIRTP